MQAPGAAHGSTNIRVDAKIGGRPNQQPATDAAGRAATAMVPIPMASSSGGTDLFDYDEFCRQQQERNARMSADRQSDGSHPSDVHNSARRQDLAASANATGEESKFAVP